MFCLSSENCGLWRLSMPGLTNRVEDPGRPQKLRETGRKNLASISFRKDLLVPSYVKNKNGDDKKVTIVATWAYKALEGLSDLTLRLVCPSISHPGEGFGRFWCQPFLRRVGLHVPGIEDIPYIVRFTVASRKDCGPPRSTVDGKSPPDVFFAITRHHEVGEVPG